MVPEAPIERTEHGLVPGRDGWFVVNARDARWFHREGWSEANLRGTADFPQLGIR